MKNMKLITEAWKRFLNEAQSWPKTDQEAEAFWPQVGKLYFSPAVYGGEGQRSTAEMDVLESDQKRNYIKVDIGPAFGEYKGIKSKFIIYSYSNEGDSQQYAKIEYSILSNWSITGIKVGAKNSKGVPSALYQIHNILEVIYKPEFKSLIQPSSMPSSVDRLRQALKPLADQLYGRVGDVSLARGVNSTEPPLAGKSIEQIMERYPAPDPKIDSEPCKLVAGQIRYIIQSRGSVSHLAKQISNNTRAMVGYFGSGGDPLSKLQELYGNEQGGGLISNDEKIVSAIYYMSLVEGGPACKELLTTVDTIAANMQRSKVSPYGLEKGEGGAASAEKFGRGVEPS